MAAINLQSLMEVLKEANEAQKTANGIAKYKFDIYRSKGKFELRLNGNSILSSLTAKEVCNCLMACENTLQIANNS